MGPGAIPPPAARGGALKESKHGLGSDRELTELDDFLRAATGVGGSPAFLTMLEELAALCRVYPRVVHELRALRNEASRLRQGAAQRSADVRRLEGELAAANAKIAGLEKLHAA